MTVVPPLESHPDHDRSGRKDHRHRSTLIGTTPGVKYSSDYVSEVLSRDPKNRFRASCLWLAEKGVITPEDVEVAIKIREYRHEVAHELHAFALDPDRAIDPTMFNESLRLIAALDRFWGGFAIYPDGNAPDEPKSLGLLLMEYIVSLVGEKTT